MRITKDHLAQIGELLRKEYHAQRVILFGSVARGTDGPDSDVDLFITAQTNQRFHHRMAAVRDLVGRHLPRLPVAPIVLTPSEVDERLRKGDLFVKEILATGIDI